MAKTIIAGKECSHIKKGQLNELGTLYSKIWVIAEFHQGLIRGNKRAPIEEGIVAREISRNTAHPRYDAQGGSRDSYRRMIIDFGYGGVALCNDDVPTTVVWAVKGTKVKEAGESVPGRPGLTPALRAPDARAA